MDVLQNNNLDFNLFDEYEYNDDNDDNISLKDILQQIINIPDIVKNKYIIEQLKTRVQQMN
jgi:hypothetical protein